MKALSFFKKIPRWVWIVLGIAFLLRLPTLFEPHRYGDEDIYFTLGMAMRKGLNFYRDIHDNKPPLIYILAGVTGNVFLLRLILLFWHGINIYIFYRLADEIFLKKSSQKSLRAQRGNLRKQKRNFKVNLTCCRFLQISIFFKKMEIFGMTRKNKEISLVILATALFSFLTTIPTFEGNIANGEIFMIMPATIGAYLLWKNRKKTEGSQFFFSGICFAIAFLFKVPIMFDLAGIVLFLWLYKGKSFKERLRFFIQPALWLILIGFLLPVVAVTLYYASIGAFKPFFYSALFQNIGYLSSWEGISRPIWQNGLFQRGIILFSLIVILFFIKKYLRTEIIFVCFWLLFSLFGVLLSGRPYPHYLIELAPPFVLLAGLIMASFCHSERNEESSTNMGTGIRQRSFDSLHSLRTTKTRLIEKVILIFMVCLVFAAFFCFKFWYYKTFPYYKNFIDFALHKKTQQEYFDFFGEVSRNYQVASFIRKRTDKNDKIFVWGTEPAIYVIAKRLPVGRYTVSYHIADFNAWNETIEKLTYERPRFIVRMRAEPKRFPQLDGLLSAHYVLVKIVKEAEIYKRINGM